MSKKFSMKGLLLIAALVICSLSLFACGEKSQGKFVDMKDIGERKEFLITSVEQLSELENSQPYFSAAGNRFFATNSMYDKYYFETKNLAIVFFSDADFSPFLKVSTVTDNVLELEFKKSAKASAESEPNFYACYVETTKDIASVQLWE